MNRCELRGYIYYTENGGVTWNLQIAGLACFIRRIFFIDDSCGWVGCINHSWEQIWLPYPPFNTDTVDVWGISFVDSLRGWFCAGQYPENYPPLLDAFLRGGQGYIAKSIDGGTNWQLLLRDTINDYFDIKFLDTLTGYVIGGNDSTMSAVVLKTTIGGVTLQALSIPVQAKVLQAMDIINNNFIWAVGHNGTIIHSRNGGQTWTMQQSNVNTTRKDKRF